MQLRDLAAYDAAFRLEEGVATISGRLAMATTATMSRTLIVILARIACSPGN